MTRIAGGLGSSLLLLAVPLALASAQSQRGEVLHLPPAPGRGQLAGSTPAPQPRARDGYDRDGDGYGRRDYRDGGYRDGYGDRDHDGRRRRAPVAYGVPVVVTNDGRVFADFGRGYEQVLRSCAAQYGATMSTAPQAYGAQTYTLPTYTLPSYGSQQRLPYTPPAPAQLTESEKMAQSVQGGGGQGSPAQGAPVCWTTDTQGRVIVVQP